MNSLIHNPACIFTASPSQSAARCSHRLDSCHVMNLSSGIMARQTLAPETIGRSAFGNGLVTNHSSNKRRSDDVLVMASKSDSDGDPTSKAILDAFFIGRALAETINERLGSALGEALSEISKRQAEQNEQIRQFQEEVAERAMAELLKATKEAASNSRPDTSSAYQTSSSATGAPSATVTSSSESSPKLSSKGIPIVPAEGLDMDTDL